MFFGPAAEAVPYFASLGHMLPMGEKETDLTVPDRQTRRTDRQTARQTDRQTNRQTERQTKQ